MLSNEIVTFAGKDNLDFYVGFSEYFTKEKKTEEDKTAINNAFFAEVERVSGVTRENLVVEAWMSNPSVKWASMSVIDATINAILPQVLLPQFGMFMDMRFVGVGDIVKFTIKPNQFYTVSRGGTGERTTHRQKHFSTDIVLTPVEHIITVYTDMYRVLAGKEDIGEFITRVVLSIEKEMYKDAVSALMTGLDKVSGELAVTGAFDPKKLVHLCQLVGSKNAGVKPVIAGSAVALMNVLPDSASGYRLSIDGVQGAVAAMKDFYGYSVVALDQAYAGSDKLVLPDDKLFIVSPLEDKLVKGAVSNSLNNSNQFYENGDLTQNFTMRKLWDFEYASAATAGVYKINA